MVDGRLWRRSNPGLDELERGTLVSALMTARRAVGTAKRAGDQLAEQIARREVNRIKVALGERGDPWWKDGAPDLNRKFARSTPYRAWFESLADRGEITTK